MLAARRTLRLGGHSAARLPVVSAAALAKCRTSREIARRDQEATRKRNLARSEVLEESGNALIVRLTDSSDGVASQLDAAGGTLTGRVEDTIGRAVDQINAASSQIVTALGEKFSTVSQRLRTLRTEGLVKRRRAGNHLFYALSDRHVADLVQNALAHADELQSRSARFVPREDLTAGKEKSDDDQFTRQPQPSARPRLRAHRHQA